MFNLKFFVSRFARWGVVTIVALVALFAAGATAAGITGTGPAILALTTSAHVDAVRSSMEDGESEIRVVALDTIESREVML